MKRFLAVIGLLLISVPASAFAATIYSNSSTGDDTTGDGSAGNPYKTFTKAYTSATDGDTLNLTGIFDWGSSAETGDASITGYVLAKNISIVGQGPLQTIIQATSTEAVADRRIFTVSIGYTVNMSNLALRYGRTTGSSNDGGAVRNNGTLVMDHVEAYRNRTTGDYGGAISSRGTTTISNSSFYNNTTYYGGGAISHNSASTTLTLTNDTIYSNSVTATAGAFYGGGVYVSTGVGYLTNNTIVSNLVTNGLGGGLQTYSGTLYMVNNIVASNTASAYTGTSDFHSYSSNVFSRGYNVVGLSQGYTATTSDWTDSNNDKVFVQTGTSATGTLNMDSSADLNDNPYSVRTFGLQAGSLAIDSGTTTTPDGSLIPSTDARGATRSGATDIGAFEYNGSGLSISAPSVQVSGLATTSVQYDRASFSWTAGNGSRRVAFVKQGVSSASAPTDSVDYAASSTFGGGTQIGSTGWYAVYDGASTTVTVTGLSQGTAYSIAVYEYNGIGTGQAVHNSSASSANLISFTTYTPQTMYVNSSTGNDTTGDGSAGNPYKTFTKAYVSANPGDIINAAGTFDLSNASETGDAATTGYTIAKTITVDGNDLSTTIFQATSTDNVADRRIFTVNSDVSFTLRNVTLRYAKVSSYSGGCILSNGSSSISFVEMYGCRSTGGSGGAIQNTGSMNLANSTFYNNVAYYSGGAVSNSQSSATTTLVMTNNTVYRNSVTASGGAFYGGGVFAGAGKTYLTNNTIVANYTSGSYGIGAGVYLNSSGSLYFANNLVASNTASYYTGTNDWYIQSGSSYVNGGGNVIGVAESYGWAVNGDWTDSNNDKIFVQTGTSATGTTALDSSLAANSNPHNAKTLAILAGSIAIDNGTSTANSGVAIPTTDQRTASRSGAVDTGAYEFSGSLVDVTPPVVSNVLPVVSTSSISITWNTDEAATTTLQFGPTLSYGSTVLDAAATTTHAAAFTGLTPNTEYNFIITSGDASGNATTTQNYSTSTLPIPDTTAPVISAVASSTGTSTVTVTWATDEPAVSTVQFGTTTSYGTTVVEGSASTTHMAMFSGLATSTIYNFRILADDASLNRATSTNYTAQTADGPNVIPSSVLASSTDTGAVISWTTSAPASSRVAFGLTSSYSSTTAELDAPSGVTSHSVTVSGLPSCALFHYAVTGASAEGNSATSSDSTFYTSGCSAEASVTQTGFGNIFTASGGTVAEDRASISVPINFSSTTSAALFQIHKLDQAAFFASIGAPSGMTEVGGSVYNFKALASPTQVVSSFDAPVTVTLSYQASDISGIDPSSLWIYRYDGSSWNALSGCVTDTSLRTVTCLTSGFSDFSIFGNALASPVISSSASASGSAVGGLTAYSTVEYGCKDPKASNYKWYVAHDQSLCVYAGAGEAAQQASAPASFSTASSAIAVPSPAYTFARNLQVGMKGADVKALQKFLNGSGFPVATTGYGSAGSETDFFGAGTRSALVRYQKAKGISPSVGYFGPLTRASLYPKASR